jgi:Trypsin-like serine proteases, typically periplasmic, contain C-terminal PDZ domain
VEDADQVKAVLASGEVREAKIVGKDQITDLAVLEIDGAGIETVAVIGDSRKLRDGEIVIAIGNPLGLSDSLTMGIVSKSKRIIPVSLSQNGVYDWEQEVIQISAQINQGNSGGALVNLNGEVVGINSMKVADYGVEGVGFAIPIHNAMPVVEQLLDLGYVPRPYLGVYTLDLEQYWEQQFYEEWLGAEEEGEEGEDAAEEDELKLPDDVKRGVIVLEAVGPAKKAGLKFNDVIVKLDDQPIGSTMELRKYLYGHKKIGEKVKVSYYRDGRPETVTVELAEKIDEEEEEE